MLPMSFFLESMAYCYSNITFRNRSVCRQQMIAMVCTTFSYQPIHYPSHPLAFAVSLLLLITVKYYYQQINALTT